jgi:hypothetical protein
MSEYDGRIAEAFSAASQEVQQGRSIEPVLAAYPEYAEEIRAMLNITAAVRAVPHPELSPESMEFIKQRTMASLHARHATVALTREDVQRNAILRSQPERRGLFSRLPLAIFAGAGALVLLMVIAGVWLASILAPQRPFNSTQVSSYSGTITSLSATKWMVGDTEVLVDESTEIHGTPAVGAVMTCIGEVLPGDRMHALEVWIHTGSQGPTIVPAVPTAPFGYVLGLPRL